MGGVNVSFTYVNVVVLGDPLLVATGKMWNYGIPGALFNSWEEFYCNNNRL